MNTAVAEQTPDRREHAFDRRIPILGWLPRYDRHHLGGDLVAGATVAAILVPEGVAYAGLAGMPPQAALYAAPVALIAYAVFGRSRQMIVGATSAVSIMSASTVAELAPEGPDRFIALSTDLALLVGLLFLLCGFLKLGFIAQFFSESVLKGFAQWPLVFDLIDDPVEEWDLIEKRLDCAWVLAPVARCLGALAQSAARYPTSSRARSSPGTPEI